MSVSVSVPVPIPVLAPVPLQVSLSVSESISTNLQDDDRLVLKKVLGVLLSDHTILLLHDNIASGKQRCNKSGTACSQ